MPKKERLNKIYKGFRNVIILIFIIYLLWIWVPFLFHSNSNKTSASNPQDESPIFNVNDEVLMQEFISNEISANDRYQNKIILITGTIYEVGQNVGSYYIMLREANDYNGVQCDFKNKNDLTNLHQGQYITLKGKVLGFGSGLVLIEDCSVVN